VTPQPKKRKQLSADEFRQRGKLEETWRKYIGHWRRFYKWLEKSPYKDLCMDGHNLNTADVFKSVFVPVPLDVFDEYIAFYGHKDDHMLKAKKTLDSFWAALVWVYDNHQPRIVVEDDLKARWKSFSTGVKKTRASDVITEGLSAYEGKDSLSRRAFRNLQLFPHCHHHLRHLLPPPLNLSV
jgi:hypothetical protein